MGLLGLSLCLALFGCSGASPTPGPTLSAAVIPFNTSTPIPAPSTPARAADSPTVPATATTTPSAAPTVTPSRARPTATPDDAPPAPATAPPASATRSAPHGLPAPVPTVTFAAYPYAQFLQPRHDATLNFDFSALNRTAYDSAASALTTTPRTVRAVILENEYLRLTFLPDLGGRLFQITYKPTNQTLFYNNRTLKPTHWGPTNQGGWLGVGGMEWAFPVSEHGYEWGAPWSYSINQNDSGATITLSDTGASNRPRVRIDVTLPAHAAYIRIHPHVENPTGTTAHFQFWINAALALGTANRVSANTDLVLPASSVFVHSTGDNFIPAANIPGDQATAPVAPVAWPVVGGVDLSHYANWPDYLGVFAADLTQSFVGAYNHDTELGLARVFPADMVPGVKLFGFGANFCCRSEFADDDSDYFEMWGGLPRTFFPSDDVTLGPGSKREWDEYWLPFAQTGGLSAATRDAVLYVDRNGGNARVSAYAPTAQQGTLALLRDGAEITRWSVSLAPGKPFKAEATVTGGQLQLVLRSDDGQILAETR